MKKRIAMLLCTAVLTLGLTMAPAMASGGPFYPIKVDEYTYGPLDELRIYRSLGDAGSAHFRGLCQPGGISTLEGVVGQ